MESALRPRDIQARIRAGASPEEVAEAAGVPVERIDAFAAPVMAERDYIAGLARTNPVRRRGETTSHRTLRNAVADALAARGIDADAAEWDAWKLEDRRWQVRVAYDADGERTEGLFVFDAMGRFSVSANDAGRALIGDGVNDQLALLRATQDEAAPDEDEEDGAEDLAPADAAGDAEEPAAFPAPRTAQGTSDEDDADDAFHDGDLTEVDGVYDIVPPARGDLDVLYDMLSSFDEDSVKIYAGLVHPKESAPEVDGPVVVEVVEESVTVTTFEVADEPDQPDEPVEAEAVEPEPDEEPTALVPRIAPIERPAPEPTPEPSAAPEADEPAASVEEPEQLSLIDDVEEPAPKPKPRPRRKRASVPSWDEIMFGAPHAPKTDD